MVPLPVAEAREQMMRKNLKGRASDDLNYTQVSYHIILNPILSYPHLSSPNLSYIILTYHLTTYSILSYPTLAPPVSLIASNDVQSHRPLIGMTKVDSCSH